MNAKNKIPATIITGFLGSGKTTLVRHILQNANGRKIAVIVNEFGELGIDGEILRRCTIGCEDENAADNQSAIFELANGCLCCTVQDEFLPVMRELIARRDALDHILIETSGLAIPKPLVQAFNWPEIQTAATVDAVITVVDTPAVAAGHFAANPTAVDAQRRADPNLDHESPLHELFEDQLGAADLVVLSKADLASAAQIAQATAIVREELPEGVRIVQAHFGALPLEVLLGIGAGSETTIDTRPSHHDHGEGGDDDHDHDHDAFTSIVLALPTVSDRAALMASLQNLTRQYTIYRVKGFVDVAARPMRLLVQGVGRRFESYFDAPWPADAPRQGRLVVIGQDVDAPAIAAQLGATLVQ